MAADIDNRQARSKPVARKTVTVVIAADATVGQANAEINGELQGFLYNVPDMVGVATTLTFDFIGEDGETWHTKAAIPENAKTFEKLLPGASPYRFAYCGVATFKCTASVVQTGVAQTIQITPYYR